MNTLELFNQAKSQNNWEKATEIVQQLCKESENGENDLPDGYLGSKIAEYENEKAAERERAKRKMGIS